jgi:tetratricopeptide (TPR) repeat protein
MHGAPLVTIDLSPLRSDEALELARLLGMTEDEGAQRRIERAGGHPLFLEQLARHPDSGSEAVPDSVRSLVCARLDRLRPELRALVDAAAVLGQGCGHDQLEHLLGHSLPIVDEAIQQRLLRPSSDGFQFAHALIRDAVYESLLSSPQQALHRRAAEWYRARDPVLHARHLARAADPAAAAAHLNAARAQLEKGAPALALELLDSAQELVSGDDARQRHWQVQSLRGSALFDLGRTAEAAAAFAAALALSASGEDAGAFDEDASASGEDARRRVRSLISLAAVLRVREETERALECLEEAERLATEALDRSEIHYHRGSIFFPRGRLDDCLREHQHALRWAREGAGREPEARALSGIADAHYQRGRLRSAMRRFDQCIAMCREHGLGAIEVANLPMRAAIRLYQLELDAAFDDLEAARRLARRTGSLRAQMLVDDVYAYVANYGARFEEARAAAERSRELAKRLGARSFEVDAVAEIGLSHLFAGERELACHHFESAWLLCEDVARSFAGAMVLGWLAWATADEERRSWAMIAGARLLEEGTPAHNSLHFFQAAIEVALGRGEAKAAIDWADQLERYPGDEPLPWASYFARLGRARAGLLNCAGEHERAGLRRELAVLREEARACGLAAALPLVDAALDGSPSAPDGRL